MSANTEQMTPEEFDTLPRKSFDDMVRFYVEGIHHSKMNDADNDFYIRKVEVI
jgi:hypothetical protein